MIEHPVKPPVELAHFRHRPLEGINLQSMASLGVDKDFTLGG